MLLSELLVNVTSSTNINVSMQINGMWFICSSTCCELNQHINWHHYRVTRIEVNPKTYGLDVEIVEN